MRGMPGMSMNMQICGAETSIFVMSYTIRPEILAGRYFGELPKLGHLAEFTLAVEKVLVIMIFIAKWLMERAGNLTGP